MPNPKIKFNKILWIDLLDSMFILLLCFATLFAAMLIKEKTGSELNYLINFKTLAAVIVSMMIYLSYLLYHSDQQFKQAISKYYTSHETFEPIELIKVEVR